MSFYLQGSSDLTLLHKDVIKNPVFQKEEFSMLGAMTPSNSKSSTFSLQGSGKGYALNDQRDIIVPIDKSQVVKEPIHKTEVVTVCSLEKDPFKRAQ